MQVGEVCPTRMLVRERGGMYNTIISCGNKECPSNIGGDCEDTLKGMGCYWGLKRHTYIPRVDNGEPDVVCKKKEWCPKELINEVEPKRICGNGLNARCKYTEIYRTEGAIDGMGCRS